MPVIIAAQLFPSGSTYRKLSRIEVTIWAADQARMQASAVKPSILPFASNYQQPYLEQYNLGVEYQIAADTSVSIGYTGVLTSGG